MTSSAKGPTTARYRKAAEQFAERAAQDLGDKIQAIVLYGLVAERKRPRDNDITVLVVTDDTSYVMRDKVASIEVDIAEKHKWDIWITSKLVTPENLKEYLRLGLPTWVDMIVNGVFLYDAGAISSQCRDVLAARGHDAS